MKTADLHMHTNHSDGTLNPVELARLAKSQNLDAIALTDHDTVTGLAELVEEVFARPGDDPGAGRAERRAGELL